MERELWPLLYHLVHDVAREIHQKYVRHQPWTLVAVALWAALHDRTASWACDPRNWHNTRLRPWELPSQSTLSRRLHSVGTGLVWRALQDRIQSCGDPCLVAFLDGKALTVSGVSKDPDARRGRAAGGMGKGYKLHAIWAGRSMPEVWEVTALNVHECTAAEPMIGQLRHGGYLVADGNYDSNGLADKAYSRGYQLVVPITAYTGRGHRRQSPHRLRNLDLQAGLFGKALRASRAQIERSFGNATAFGGGLGPLPAWIRRQRRVQTWVWAKLLINAARIHRKEQIRKQRLTA